MDATTAIHVLADALGDDDILLRALKWKKTADGCGWIPPYNQNIYFERSFALEVCADGFFLSDMADGRW